MEQLYSYGRAAKLLEISERNLKRLLHEKKLPVCYVGKRVRIPEATLKELVITVLSEEFYDYSIEGA